MNDLSGGMKPFGIVEAIAGLQHPATLAELSSLVGVPKPTVHRWLGALETAGLVQRTPGGRHFELASRASQIAFSILTNRVTGKVRHEILQRVAETVREACNLTVLDGTEISYLDRVESSWPLRITFQPGSRVPAYCSASGKLFLALMPPSKRDLIIEASTFERLTENTIADKKTLLKELGDIRRDGFALDREEFMRGLACLAVPVMQRKGRSNVCVAALAIQAPVTRMTHQDLLTKLSIVQAAAQEIAATLAE